MKSLLIATMLAAFVAPATAAADVGLSISVGQPGFYGQINIGDYPRPRLMYSRPVVVAPPAYGVAPPPIYLHVPPGQARHWRYYCSRYNACGRPVYFVQDYWYNNVYVPRYRERHRYHDYYRDRDHDHYRYRRHDDDRRHDRDRRHDGDHRRDHDRD